MISKVRIGDLGKIVTGNTPPRNKPEYYGTYTPFIKATDINGSSKFTYSPEEAYSESGHRKYISSLIPKGSTCVVTIGSIGQKMTMAHCDCFINQAMNAIIPSLEFDPEYVYYVVKNNIYRLKSLDSGTASGRENVSKSAFSNLEIDVIRDLSVQRKIGAILSSFDDLIETNQKQIKLLEEAAQRLYKEWFVDLRFPGHETTSIVNGVPEGWRKDDLKRIALLKAGGDRPQIFSKERTDQCTVPVFSNGTENEGLYGYTDKAEIEDNCVTISARGSVGYTCLRKVGFVPIVRLIVAIPIAIDVEYLFFCLKNMQIDSNGAAQQQITVPMIKNKQIVLPSDDILNMFICEVRPMMNLRENLKLQMEKLIEARDRLLPKLMNGEIEV